MEKVRDKAAIVKTRREFTRAFYTGNHLAFTGANAMMAFSSVLDIALAYFMQMLVDCATTRDVDMLWRLFWIAIFTLPLYWLSNECLRRWRSGFIRKAMLQYKASAFEKITRKNISSFAGETTSRYISALTNDAASIEENVLVASFRLVLYGIWFVGALALMLYYSWQLTLIVIAGMCLPIAVSLAVGGRLTTLEEGVSAKNEGFVGAVKDLLSGFTVIKSFKAEREVNGIFAREDESLEDTKRSRRMAQGLIEILSTTAALIMQFGMFFLGVFLVIRGDITVGMVIAFVQASNYIIQPVQNVPKLLAARKASMALVDKLAASVSENAEREGRQVPGELKTSIGVRDVSFGYEGGESVLKNVSAEFLAGRSYAIVGGSGSGKSTLLNLLMGGYDGYEGEIRFDGNELREISSESLYDILSIVQQNVFVFNSSIRDNITLYKEFPEGKIQAAIDKSGLRQLINERGADYLCGENGSGLSGGERQRISIARCLLRETPVLLVDEATAALDASTAFAVTNSILDIEGLTRILVTHKLEDKLLERYDGIFALRNGEIVERGTFEELMAKKGYFYSLYTVAQ